MKLVYSSEIANARRTLKPMVALETSVLVQGLPYPHNVEAAKRCEAAIRDEGAIPAPMAVIEGQLFVGLDAAQTRLLVTGKNLMKIGSRDLSIAVARKASGGTTVSATCDTPLSAIAAYRPLAGNACVQKRKTTCFLAQARERSDSLVN